MKKINVVIFGHGSLCIWLSKYIKSSKKYKLHSVIVPKIESIFDLSIKNWCLHNKINTSVSIKALKNTNFDLGISIHYGDIIKNIIIKKFDNIVNLHNSLLPQFRGVNPVNWAIKLRKSIGITLHKVEKRIDSGSVIYSKKIKQKNDIFNDSLECKKQGILLLKKFLRDYPEIKYFNINPSKKYYSIKKSNQLGIYRYINQKKSIYKIYGNFLLHKFKKNKSSLFIFNGNLPDDFNKDYKKKYHILLLSDKIIKLNKNCVIRDKVKNFENIYQKLTLNKTYFNKIDIQSDLMKKYNLYKFKNLLIN